MPYVLLAIVAWLLCAVCAYELQRHNNLRRFKSWTHSDRSFYLPIALISGPGALFASLIIWMSDGDDDRGASW